MFLCVLEMESLGSLSYIKHNYIGSKWDTTYFKRILADILNVWVLRVKFEYNDVGLTCMYVYLNLPNSIAFFLQFCSALFLIYWPAFIISTTLYHGKRNSYQSILEKLSGYSIYKKNHSSRIFFIIFSQFLNTNECFLVKCKPYHLKVTTWHIRVKVSTKAPLCVSIK